jgi:pimeloyl-ACP methyl ester carboxylesterase
MKWARLKMIFFYFSLSILAIAGILCFQFGYRDIPVEKLKGKYANADSKFIEVLGMQLHYRIEGNRTDSIPLVLLHGAGASLHTWDEFVRIAGVKRKIIRLDLPAYGLTGPTLDRNYNVESYTSVIVTFLGKLGIQKCDLVGNSLGGYISWAVSLKKPSLVRRLVLMDAIGYPLEKRERPLAFKLARMPVINKLLTFITPRSIVEKSVLNLYFDKTKVTNELVDRYFELTLREGNRQAFVDISSSTTESNLYKEIPSITQPTLIIWGAEDKFVPLESANRFDSDIPNSKLEVLPQVGHMPMEESPIKTAELILKFTSKQLAYVTCE